MINGLKQEDKPIDRVAHEKVLDILENAKPVELLPGADAELGRALNRAISKHPA